MRRISSDLLLPPSVRPRCGRHYNRYGSVLVPFRRTVHREFLAEIERMCHSFVQGPLQEQAAPLLAALRDYTGWLGWCVWCSTHLAPPLGLVGDADAKRMAAALLVYCGPRLIDDAIDNHRTYKGKRETLLEGLIAAFPDIPPASVRCQVGLLGSWMTFYGVQRLERHGHPQAARRTLRLCERVAPGAVLESLHAGPLSWEQYCQIVALKAVHYDEILYRNLIDPVPQPLKGRLLRISARLSRLAQYLNDFRDVADDLHKGQKNLLEWFPSESDFWMLCQTEVAELVGALDSIPTEAGDAFSAALVETIDAAARLDKAPSDEAAAQVLATR
jgi:hypothetical protein